MQRRGDRAGPCPHPLEGRPRRPLPLRGTPPSRSPEPGGGGGGGAGGARRGRTCAPSRAGESPGEHVPRRAGGGESRGRLHCCCCCRRGRRCLFLPPAPSPPRPGRGAPCAELGRARRSRRRAPQAAAAAATVVAAVRAGKLCPFVRSAPEAAGRQRCLLHHPDPGERYTGGEAPHPALPPSHSHLLTSCLGLGWVRVKNPPSQDDPFFGDCRWYPPPDPGPQQVGERPPTESYHIAAEEVKKG